MTDNREKATEVVCHLNGSLEAPPWQVDVIVALIEFVEDANERGSAALAVELAQAEADKAALAAAIAPFAAFFKGPRHDLSPAADHVITASFQDQETGEPLAELTIGAFRRAHEAMANCERAKRALQQQRSE